jgi:hypothetical protein
MVVTLSNQIDISIPASLHSRVHLFFSITPTSTVVAYVHERTHAHTPPQTGHTHTSVFVSKGNMEYHIRRLSMIFMLQCMAKGF